LKNILVVDDERQITRMLRASLQSSGYAVIVADNGVQAYGEFEAKRPDLVITDLAMPEMNGLELTQSIRAVATTPIIVLSVRDADTMKIAALDAGADDYLTKPFSVPELLARVRAQLRRVAQSDSEPLHIELGDFVLDIPAHSVAVRGEELHLTPKEFDLLTVLLRNADKVMTHKALLRSIWGPVGDGQPEYLRVLVAQLRKKLDTSGFRYIQSEPWVGYRLKADGSATP
jgi:two-component system KDP operon response regulator KdpE